MRRGWVALVGLVCVLGACTVEPADVESVATAPAAGLALWSCPVEADRPVGQNAWGLTCESVLRLPAGTEVEIACSTETSAPDGQGPNASNRWFRVRAAATDSHRAQTGWVWSGVIEPTASVGECASVGNEGTSPLPTSTVVTASDPLHLEIVGNCTSAGGKLTSISSGFTPYGSVGNTAWYPDGRPYRDVKQGSLDITGTGSWHWTCAGDPPGVYGTEVVDRATGRTVRASFTIGRPAKAAPAWRTVPVTATRGTRTWTNAYLAGGDEGPRVAAGVQVGVTCRLSAYAEADGNVWWYRLAGDGWDNRFYASAHAFSSGSGAGSGAGPGAALDAVPEC